MVSAASTASLSSSPHVLMDKLPWKPSIQSVQELRPSVPFCQFCGNEVSQDAAFCPHCGHPISAAAMQPRNSSSNNLPAPNPSGILSPLLEPSDFVMNKKIFSLREHYDFEDTMGNKIGEGDGNFFQMPAKFDVVDKYGAKVMEVHGKLISIRNQFTFKDFEGHELGVIKKKILKLIGEEYWVEQNGVEIMRVYGNFTEHDYKMEIDKAIVATVHKKWVAVRDSFGVSINGSVDHRLVIGAVIAVEHEEVTERERHNQ